MLKNFTGGAEYEEHLRLLKPTVSRIYGNNAEYSDYDYLVYTGDFTDLSTICVAIFGGCNNTCFQDSVLENNAFVALKDGTLVHLRVFTGTDYKDDRMVVVGDGENNVHFICYPNITHYTAALAATEAVSLKLANNDERAEFNHKKLFMAYFELFQLFETTDVAEILDILNNDYFF